MDMKGDLVWRMSRLAANPAKHTSWDAMADADALFGAARVHRAHLAYLNTSFPNYTAAAPALSCAPLNPANRVRQGGIYPAWGPIVGEIRALKGATMGVEGGQSGR
eukprot:172872-Prorocentrum_minimum.AAC.4